MKQEKKYVSDVPELLKEWDYEKNERLYSPDKITIGNSRTRVNWICSTCGFRWPASVYNRHHLGRGCRQCGNKRISEKLHNLKLKKGVNDLASQHPDLLLEWDYEKNSTICAPDEITIGNGSQKVHWICSTCGYRWPATVYSRVHLNSGCPPCGDLEICKKSRERRFDPNKNLLTLFPDIAAEWHPTKNTSLELEKVMPGSNNDVWWLCSTCGTEYHTQVVNRTGYKHVGCRTCNKHMHTAHFSGNKNLVVSISTSFEIAPELIAATLGGRTYDYLEFKSNRIEPGYPLYNSDVCNAVRAITDILNSVASKYSAIHLFAAIPAGLAVELGRNLLTSVYQNIYTYQLTQGKYIQDIIINEVTSSGIPENAITSFSLDSSSIIYIPILGRVPCGPVKEAITEDDKCFPLPESVLDNGDYYILIASGDS